MHETWTTDRIALLERLWAEGKTAHAIAACLGGTSRSAVLGKIFRLRLGTPAAPPLQAQMDAPVLSWRRGHPRPYKRGKTLFELTNNSCRWPFGDPGTQEFHFCGAAGADFERGMPYCVRHARRAYCMIDTQAANQTQAWRSDASPAPPFAQRRSRIAANAGRRR
jgi:GcrA cell cycle regulator